MSDSTVLDYYARHGLMTDPHQYAFLLDGLPADMASLCRIVQGVLIHIFWAERYGVKLSDERKQEVELRENCGIPTYCSRVGRVPCSAMQ